MSANLKPISILVIDDDPIIRNLTRSYLKEKAEVFVVEAPSTAFRILENEKIDLVITDFKLPEMDGLQVLERIKKEYTGIEVIMISSSSEMNTVIGALRKGAADYCRKPFTSTEIWLSIERTTKYAKLQSQLNTEVKKNDVLKKTVDQEVGCKIIGESPLIQQVKNQMEMVASTPDTSVLLIGESGTGKELVARGIHMLSQRNDSLFGAVNMSAIPDTLFESEFFGHKKGSFTGAISDKSGWFESINKGTLFLDEIGEMPMSLQVKLLRVLEDRKYTKLGTQDEMPFDIRIISATNKTVEELTGGKVFRLDLFHRIGTFIIQIPPLRDRISDIAILVDYFVNIIGPKMGKQIESIDSAVISLLQKYPFPGNIRELKNMVERAIIMCNDKVLKKEHFYLIDNLSAQTHRVFDEANNLFDLKELEKQTIIKALGQVNYNKAEAARLLNLEWNALYRRIQKYDIVLPNEN